MNFSVSAMAECLGDCNAKTIGFTYRLLRKNVQEVDTLSGATFYARCGNSNGFTQTLNTELGDPQEYFIGDTIVYEIHRFSVCPTPGLDSQACGSFNFIPIEHPPLSDFYVLDESDFCD